MSIYFGSPVSLIPSGSLSIVEAIQGSIVFIISADQQAETDSTFRLLASFAERTKLVAFIGDNSEYLHDKFDDAIIDAGHLGSLTTFSNLDQTAAIKEALDMSCSYQAKALFVTISDCTEREFIMLSHISMSLAKLSDDALLNPKSTKAR